MEIAIVADTHDNLKNLEKALNWINKEGIELILHCGDISRQETIDFIAKKFQGEIKYVKGNADYNLDLLNSLELEVDGKKIWFDHYPEEAKRMALSGKYDLALYGHTHRPWDKVYGNCHMINPGELAGQFYKPTFAVYDTKTQMLELKILEKL